MLLQQQLLLGTAVASDNCDDDVTVSYADTTVAGTGNNSVITRVWTATDDNSNSATYTQTITVVDTTAPTFTTSPASVTVQCDAATTTTALGTAVASDNCDDDVTVSYADTTVAGTGNNSVITRVWTATDDNSNSATYTQTITVVDTTAPTFTTSPASVTVQCDAATTTTALGTAVASDNCGQNDAPTISGFTLGGTFGNSHYYISNTSKNWTDAQTLCEANGGNLVSISSEIENSYVSNLMPNEQSWIGLTDQTSEGQFEWSDETELNYNKWWSGEPSNSGPTGNEDYTLINTTEAVNMNDGYWNDVDNNTSYRFVMEITVNVTITYVDTTVAGTGNNSVITRVWTATDDNSNSATYTQTITVVDTTAPTFTTSPADVTVQCDASTAPSATGTAVASDNCDDDVTVSYADTTVAGTGNNSVITRVWTATDDNSNSATYTQTITVVDTTAPTFTTSPADVTVQCSASTEPSATGTAVASDNCDDDVTVSYADTTVAGTGNNSVITRVWTATDDNSNSATYTQTITVVDTTAPTFTTSPADVTVQCSASTEPSATGTAVASDNCDDDVTVSYADTTVAGTGNNSVITRVWTATDDNSNSATYTQTITVVDTTAPTFTTSPADVTVQCDASTAPSATGTAVASDNCDDDVTVSYADTTVAGTGNNSVITRVWTATDDNSNSATYTQTITVVDTTAPTFTTSPASVTVECSASTEPSATGTAVASDNCDDDVTVSYADTTVAGTGNNSVITRVWTATDDNSNSATYTQTITVVDTTAPTFTTSPADVTVQCSASTEPSATGTAVASDNCDDDVTVSYADTTVAGTGNNSVITRVWTATDDNSNSATYTQTITVVDTTAPVADVANLADVTAECSVETLTAPTATDNCGGSINGIITEISVYLNWNVNEPNNHNGGENYGMILDNGKWNDHRGDNSNPDFIMESDSDLGVISGFNFIGSYNGHYYYQSTSNHNWNNANNIAVSSGGYLVIITSQGENEFIEQNAVITIHGSWIGMYQDTSNSSYSEPAGGWYWVDGSEVNTSTNNTLPITAEGTTVVTWTFTDDNGNATTQTQNVIIDDVTAPIFTTSPASVTVQCDAATTTTALGTAVASDNCDDDVTVTSVDSTVAGTGNNSVITRVWTATDDNSNSATYTQTITVVDTTAPTFTTSPASVTVECSASTEPSATGTAVASDNCDDDVTVSYADTTVAGTGNNSVITRVWTATDDNSNSATYTQTITVVDTTAPTFTTSPADVTVQCSASTEPSATGTAVASDNCDDDVTVSYADTTVAGTGNNSVITRVWTATDDNSNSATYTQTITVVDTTAPVADVANLADVTAECSVETLTAPTATDNCGGSINGIITEISVYLNWNVNEPNNHNGGENYGMILDNGKWNDHRGDNSNPDFIMESDSDLGVISGFNFIGSYNGHYYYQSTSNHNWNNANNIAVSSGGYLVIITSQGENEFIEQNAVITIHGSWIGMYQDTSNSSYSEPAGGWYWVDGSEVNTSTNNTLPITAEGTTVVTWTFTDDNGNATTQTQNVIIDDVTAPIFTTSPASVTVQCDAATTTTALGTAVASDNCDDDVTVTSVDSTVAGTGNNSVITRVWTATDDNSNSATYTQTITVVDTTAPVADELILADITAECSVETLAVPSATDNCAGLKRGETSTVFPITSQGTTVVTWTFTDDNGNVSTQTQNVIINDITAPTFTTSPADVTVQCSASTAPSATGTAVASDNCDDDVTVSYADTTVAGTGNNSVITRVWTATDDNSNSATYTQTITVVDTTAPTFTTSPADVTVECDASTAPSATGTAVATDNCDSSVSMSFTDTVDSDNEIVLCSYSDLPNNIKNGLVGYWPFCGNTDDETGNENNGINNNSQLTEDRFGNENNAYLFSDLDQSMITINPSESLFISGDITLSAWFYPTDTTVGYIVDRDECGFNDDWGLQWKDGQVKLRTQNNENDIVSGVLDINNWYHVLVTRSIESGLFTMYINSQITSQVSGFNYSFTNTNLPIRIGDQSCTSPEPNFDGKIDDIAIWNRMLTNEEIVSLYNNFPNENNNSVITRVWTATDDNGNSSTYTQTITVVDTTAPVADVANLEDVTAECSVDTLTVPTATDNCSGTIAGTTSTVLPITAQGTTVVTWTFEDASGNISTQTQNVVIDDVTAPVADVANLEDVTAECSVDTLTVPTATDNCSGTITGTTSTTFPITAQGTTVVTWTFEDASGNISTQTQNVVIDDVTGPGPDVAVLDDITAECSVDTLTAPTATDNCSGTITGTTTTTTFPITAQGTTVVTWTFEDASGNISTQTQNVVIDDVTGPGPDVAVLDDITAECSVDTLTAPTATDNCSGTITGTTSTVLPITAQGTTVVTWTFEDASGNISTQTQNVIINDVTAPVADVANLEDVTAECSVDTLTVPTATDNCSGTITGTTSTVLPITAQGTTVVTWTFEDASGNISTQTQNVVIDDITGPGPDVADLEDVTAECSVDTLTVPTATDNCSGTITGTTSTVLPITAQGTTLVTWTFEDANGNISTQTQNVVIDDVTGPAPDVADLEDVTAECSVDTLTAPTATDNCSGTITGTTTTVLPITAQGTTVVTWTFEDNEGNTTTQTQTVVVIDTTAPGPDVADLDDVTAECSVDTLTVPTATDNCSGTITGTTSTIFPITAQGTTVVTWTFEDASGNISTQTQNVIINDVTAPVADVANLEDVTAECSVDTLTAPTATDNCSGTITGTTTTTFPITAQGTTVVTWTFEDASGNISTQTQNVVIDDVTGPGPDVAVLDDITAECSVDTLTAPTATDNCSGTIAGTTSTVLPITAQGTTVVTWTFEDASGNISTQTQNVVIDDVTAPVPDVANLEDVTAECSVDTLTVPTATDNCSGTIAGTTSTVLPITAQGTTVVTWTFEDASGNISTQTQNVVIDDITGPGPDVADLEDVTAECSVDTLTVPTATDNCSGTITGTTSTTFPITAQGTTVVTWTFEDASGNISTQTQNVVIDDVTGPGPDVAVLDDITAECSVDTLTAPTATDNCSGTITGTTSTVLPITAQGTTVVTWTFEDNEGNTTTQTQTVVVIDTTAPVADVADLDDVTAECSVDTLTVPTATDNCSGTITGTTTTVLPITAQGTTVVTWTFEDASGNISTQTQNVIINDVTVPVADVANLEDVTAECSVDTLTVPTATDNCSGTITGTTSTTFPITAQGTTVVTWTFEDASGNISTQTQNVVIDDVTGPGPDVAVLDDITAECSVDTLTAPTATDNCSGTITGTTTTTFPITAQGTTVVTWTFEDASGNISTQTQNVVIDDVTGPGPDVAVLDDITAECSVDTLTAPTATDNCSGTITGTTSTVLPITAQGTTVVTWTFEDASGNISTQTQNVVIDDVTAPVPDVADLEDVTAECSVDTLTVPTATDNCSGTITGTTSTVLPITAQGTTVVTWTFEDASGNISTQTQNVEVIDATMPINLDDEYIICNDSENGGLGYVIIDSGLTSENFTFVWKDEFGNILSNEEVYQINQGGFYSLEIYSSGCLLGIEEFTVIEINTPTAVVDIITEDFSNNNIITITPTSNGTYEFSIDQGVWQSDGIFMNVNTGSHTLEVRDVRGCGEKVYEIYIIDYPRFFTPNGDGFNDIWNISGLPTELNSKIYIFDRFGKLLKEISPSGYGWDGTFNGQQMPTNDYWFIVKYSDLITGELKEFRSHFTLKR